MSQVGTRASGKAGGIAGGDAVGSRRVGHRGWGQHAAIRLRWRALACAGGLALRCCDRPTGPRGRGPLTAALSLALSLSLAAAWHGRGMAPRAGHMGHAMRYRTARARAEAARPPEDDPTQPNPTGRGRAHVLECT